MPAATETAWQDQADRLWLLALRREQARRQAQTQALRALFQDTGPFARQHYAKHVEFFAAGARHRERLFLAANRIGKTRAACFEDTLHLTGLYDQYAPWWDGRRFSTPIKAWVWATTDEKVKETVQEELFGPVGAWGTGLIPGTLITKIDRASGPLRDLIDTAYIQHVSGGTSTLQFKSYKQGRQAAEGTFRHLIHLDEEAPADIYGECVVRTMDTSGSGAGNGCLMMTFTPLQGLSETVLQFLPDGQLPEGEQTGSTYVVNASWDDVPHLDATTKADLLAAIPPYLRDARTRGLPVLGAGVIYPVPEEDYLIDAFELPKHYLRCYGLDVGWNWTAALHGAYDRDTDTWYLYHEYKRGQVEPSVHANAVKGPGDWIPGVIDPAANGRSQADGGQLLVKYQQLGLHLTPAQNTVETGLYECWERLTQGRLKVCRHLSQWRQEVRLYRRDDLGRIVKVNDHLMDAMRYLVMSGLQCAKAVPPKPGMESQFRVPTGRDAWMA